MFKYKYKVPKKEFDTTYGSICIENVIFEPNEIEKVLFLAVIALFLL